MSSVPPRFPSVGIAYEWCGMRSGGLAVCPSEGRVVLLPDALPTARHVTEQLAFAGAARQAELVRSGEVSPVDLVELSLERIARLDPQLNAFRVVLADQARMEAE